MLANGITNFYGGAVTEPLRIIACLGGAWIISWRLTLASLIFAPLAAFLILYLNRKIRSISLGVLGRSMGFHHVMLEVFNSLLTVQANTMEDFERRSISRIDGEYRRFIALKATFYHALASPVTELLGMGMLCTGVVVSGYLVINQETHIFGIGCATEPLSIRSVTVFFALLIGASDPLRKLSGVITGVNSGMAAAGILYPILEMKPNMVETTAPKPLPTPHERIEFRDIHFSYDGIQKVLENVNLTIERGDHLAIVGPNGGGKSTLINLLCRFYDPQQGDVLFDGVSLRDVAIKDLRSRIALVTQQTELFNESILHNIRYGRWDATRRRGRRGRSIGASRCFHFIVSERLSHDRRSKRPATERRPTAADCAGPGLSAQCGDSDSRRGDQPDRRRKRTADPRSARRIWQGSHADHDHASRKHAVAREPESFASITASWSTCRLRRKPRNRGGCHAAFVHRSLSFR